ncbi:MAG TPA: hypothetical protein PKC69_07870 [Chitinophagaceae bacterium]|nr:hypothetical protein [Chitinophagaceae bacterium]
MRFPFLLFSCFFLLSACAQKNNNAGRNMEKNVRQAGGGCEGCEVIYESPVPFASLSWQDTLPDFTETKGSKLIISGTVYQADGVTPAKDVVMYIYHTDQDGVYSNRYKEKGMAARHGYIKGWIKTNEKGQYRFYTLIPIAYPGEKEPAHIHPVVKEPGFSDYYIDEFVFDDDPLLTTAHRQRMTNRGGNGILVTEEKDGVHYAERNIYLGRNIPGYPQPEMTGIQSGLDTGDPCPAFDPVHLSGIDKGKPVCPMCKYGYGQGVMVWFNHGPDELALFAKQLETAMQEKGEKQLRVFLVYTNPFYKENDKTENKIVRQKMEKWAQENNLQKVALLWVPSPVDAESSALFKINPEAKNTVFVYKKRKVAAKWVNIDYADASAVSTILSAL